MVYIFTGNGKGKTTSAIGMGIRAVGIGKKVLLIRFLKAKGSSSEEKVIEGIRNFGIKSFGRKGFFLPQTELKKKPELKRKGVKPLSEKDLELFQKGMALARKAAKSKKYGLLILDEVIIALKFGLITKKELLDFLKENKERIDIVLTGRYCPKELIKIADLVTEMREVKHYYQKGVRAIKGIEY